MICKGNHWAHIHQVGVFDVLINGLAAELDDWIDSASATLITARVGIKKTQCSSGTRQTTRLVGLDYIVAAEVLQVIVVKIKADRITPFSLLQEGKLNPGAYGRSWKNCGICSKM